MVTVGELKLALKGHSDDSEIVLRNKKGKKLKDVKLNVVYPEQNGLLFG